MPQATTRSGALSGLAFGMTFRVRVRVGVGLVLYVASQLYCAQSAGPDNAPDSSYVLTHRAYIVCG